MWGEKNVFKKIYSKMIEYVMNTHYTFIFFKNKKKKYAYSRVR